MSMTPARKKKLEPYIKYIRDYDALGELSVKEFNKELANIQAEAMADMQKEEPAADAEPKSRIEELSILLIESKKSENRARRERIEIEELIAKEFKDAPTEGSKTEQFGNFKVTIKNGVTIKADFEKMRETLDPTCMPIKQKQELDKKGVEWIKEHKPDQYKLLCECLTSKPSKTSITVKEVE